MNPRDFSSRYYDQGHILADPPAKSEFELELENAKRYFGADFPGNEDLTCIKCGASVNLGWQHIAWHEAA